MRRRPEEIAKAAAVFKALAHPQRLQLACLLVDGGELTQKRLVDDTGLPQSTVSRHLELLRQAGLVRGRRQAQEIQLSVAGAVLSRLLDAMCDWFQELEHAPAAAAEHAAADASAPPAARRAAV